LKRSRSVAGVVAILLAAVLANVVTLLPARATETAGLSMTPARCRAVAAREHLTCHQGPLANRGPHIPGQSKITTAIKRVPYRTISAQKVKPRVK
jgi:hypothetical protein